MFYISETVATHLINPFMPNETSHRYHLDQSIFVLRVVKWYISYLSKF